MNKIHLSYQPFKIEFLFNEGLMQLEIIATYAGEDASKAYFEMINNIIDFEIDHCIISALTLNKCNLEFISGEQVRNFNCTYNNRQAIDQLTNHQPKTIYFVDNLGIRDLKFKINLFENKL